MNFESPMTEGKKMRIYLECAALACCIALSANAASATELVYVPVNPSFGGNPQNGPILLGTASATSKHVANSDLGSSSLLKQTALDQFNQTLERTVLSQLASAATSKLIGTDGKLMPGTFATTNFTISIEDIGGGLLRITTTDKTTGASTSFEVGQ